jgi:hypothetical protein
MRLFLLVGMEHISSKSLFVRYSLRSYEGHTLHFLVRPDNECLGI